MLLLFCLLVEFNSFRRTAIILVTVPLAAVGIVPGLLISGQPFGFMSLLGVITLIGIVVNNAILLIEVIETRRAEGAGLDEAVTDAIVRRTRPIALTTITTVAGLSPMAFTSSTMWPPLAWAIISGLTASTFLTLVVIPALYKVIFAHSRAWRRAAPAAAATALAVFCLSAPASSAAPAPLTFEDTVARAVERPAAKAADAQSDAARHAASAERRAAFLPIVGGQFSASDRDRQLSLVTPIGEFPFGKSRSNSAGIELRQPILDPARMLFGARAARREAEATRQATARTRKELTAAAALAHLDALSLDAQLDATEVFVGSLRARLEEVTVLVEAGRALEADALKVHLALDGAEQEALALRATRSVALEALAQAVGTEEAVEALAAPDWTERAAPELEDAVSRALEARSDLRALGTTRQAIGQRRRAVLAEALPRVEGRVAWTWTDGSPYSIDNWVEGSVTLSWSPFAAGTRQARVAALGAQRRAVTAQLREARRSIEIEVHAALSAIETARAGVDVGLRGVEQAGEALRVERERHNAGRSTVNDLLQAEAGLREQQTRLAVARLDVVRAWVRLWLAGGVPSLLEGA